jgi:hypothetical protein
MATHAVPSWIARSTAVACERCGFTHYRELRDDGRSGPLQLGQLHWCYVDGQRIRLCLGCAMEARQTGSKVEVR